MFDPKHVADLVTFARGLLAFALVWLGWSQGVDGLRLAVYLMLVNWIGDILDGTLARRSLSKKQTWIGDHDLEVDITVSAGLLGYMLGAGFVNWPVAAGYLLAWILIFWHWGYLRSLGMLVQAPIYFMFIVRAILEPPHTGWWMVALIISAVVITWPRFPREVIPGFLKNFREITKE